MVEQARKTWLRRRVEDGLRRGFQHAYETVKVDPSKFLLQVRAAYGLPISNFQGVYSVEVGQLDDLAHRVIRSGMKVAAAEGAGFGLGGLITIVPDLGILSAVTSANYSEAQPDLRLRIQYRRRNRGALDRSRHRRGSRHQPGTAGEGSSEPVCPACDSAHRTAGQCRNCGEMVRAADSPCQFSHRRRV